MSDVYVFILEELEKFLNTPDITEEDKRGAREFVVFLTGMSYEQLDDFLKNE